VTSIGQRLSIAGVAALAAAIVAVAALAAVYGRSPAIRLEMDREKVPGVSGFFPSERDRDLTFAWMGRSAAVEVPGLDRRVPWTCAATVAVGVPAGVRLPALRFSADGLEIRTWQIARIPEVVSFEIPARPDRSGVVVGIAASGTFKPGPQDSRELGAAFDRLACEPAEGRSAMPPWHSMIRAAAAAAALGAAFGLAGLPALAASGLAALVALAQAWPLAFGMAPYHAGAVPALPVAAVLALGLVLAMALVGLLRRVAAPVAWRAAAAVTAMAGYLKLLVLLHPSMPIMDALFQAHRLEWVLAGRYYFTSLTPDGYLFPYGISLYLAAAPLARLVPDHVALVRLTVVAAECAAGLLVFAMAARAWSDRRAALLALALFHATPIAQGVIGTGNLTNAFGESMAVASVAAMVLLPVTAPAWLWVLLPGSLAAFAFVAHFSTLVVLSATMAAIGLCWRWLGDPPVRRAAARVMACLAVAVALSFAAFYGHFWDTYRAQAQRLAGEVRAIAADDARATSADAGTRGAPPKAAKLPPPAGERFWTMLRRTRGAFVVMYGALALAGAVLIVRQQRRDRLSLAIWAWMASLAAFSALAVLTPLEMRYHLAVAPALAILAAAAISWSMQGPWSRTVAGAVAGAVVALGARGWYGWLF
jgi:hypothetical protein